MTTSAPVPEVPLDDLLSNHRKYHPDIAIDRYIIAKAGVTPWGMYLQALRELYGRYYAAANLVLVQCEHEIEAQKLALDLEEAETKARGTTVVDPRAELEIQRINLKLQRHRLRTKSVQHTLRDALREYLRHRRIAEVLHQEFGDVDEDRRQELDLDRYVQELSLQAAQQIRTQGSMSGGTWRDVLMLPPKEREEVFQQCYSQQVVIWADDQYAKELMPPDVGTISDADLEEARRAILCRLPLLDPPKLQSIDS